MIKISNKLKDKYDTLYSDNTEEWRRKGAIGKVENIIDLTRGLDFNKVIDIGAGDGNVLSLLSSRNFCSDLTAVEVSESALKQISKKNIPGLLEIKRFDGYILPFADQEFDLAICSHVMEHVEHPRKLLLEIKRISKRQLFEVPIDFSVRVDKKFNHFHSYGHINIYTPALFNFLLLSAGFKIEKSKYALYKAEVTSFIARKYSVKNLLILVKRILWKLIPALMKFKPNTYSVLTR